MLLLIGDRLWQRRSLQGTSSEAATLVTERAILFASPHRLCNLVSQSLAIPRLREAVHDALPLETAYTERMRRPDGRQNNRQIWADHRCEPGYGRQATHADRYRSP